MNNIEQQEKQIRHFQELLYKKEREAQYWKKIATDRLLSFFQSINPKEDDIILFKIPVGNMPVDEISNHISKFADGLMDKRTDGGFLPFEVFWLPYRSSDEFMPTVEVLSPNDDDILVIRIPIGNLSNSDAQSMIEEIQSTFKIRHHKISDVIWVPERGDTLEFNLLSESDMKAAGWVKNK